MTDVPKQTPGKPGDSVDAPRGVTAESSGPRLQTFAEMLPATRAFYGVT